MAKYLAIEWFLRMAGSLLDSLLAVKMWQRQLLEAEGVKFNADGRVDMNQCRWDSPDRHRAGLQNPCAALLGELLPCFEYEQKEIDHLKKKDQ